MTEPCVERSEAPAERGTRRSRSRAGGASEASRRGSPREAEARWTMKLALVLALAACWTAPRAPAPEPHRRAERIHRHWPPPRALPELSVHASHRAPVPLIVFALGPPLASREVSPRDLEALHRAVLATHGHARIDAYDRWTAALEAAADVWTDPAKVAAATDAYRALLAEPGLEAAPQGDELLYRAARALHYAHDDLVAAATFERLISAYPRSMYVGDAYAAAADAISGLDAPRAKQLFAQAIANGRSTAVDFARYQLVLLHLARGEQSEALVRAGELASQGANAEVREVGARLAVRPYAEVGVPGDAYAYFAQRAGELAPELVQGLAEIYLETGKTAEAITALGDLDGHEASDGARCYDRVLLLRARIELGSRQDVLDAAHAVVEAARTAPECRSDADREIGELAWLWQVQLPRAELDARMVERMWRLALAVVTTDERRQVATRDLAQLVWEIAEVDPRAWPAAAEALDAAAAENHDAALAEAAAEARANATRR